MLPAHIDLLLPDWVADVVEPARTLATDADKMALAVELSRFNVAHGSGGPFGAAVFGPDHRVIAAGVNRAVAQNTSLARAENMACMLAQQHLLSFRIDAVATPATLASSARPCCQCNSATVRTGIDRLLIGARAEDVMDLTPFDEGPLPADGAGELERRGIAVVRDLHRDAAREVLRRYGEEGARY